MACDLHDHTCPLFGSMLCCRHLEILSVDQGALYFGFVLGPTNYVAGRAYRCPRGGNGRPREKLGLGLDISLFIPPFLLPNLLSFLFPLLALLSSLIFYCFPSF